MTEGAPMPDTSREYPYRPKAWAVLVIVALFGGGAVLMGYKAAGNDLDNVPWFYWTECVVCALAAAFYGTVGVAGFVVPRRVALTSTVLLLPKSLWSAREVAIGYGAITSLELRPPRAGRRLYITHPGGKARIVAELLPNMTAFLDVCESLAARVAAARTGEPGPVA